MLAPNVDWCGTEEVCSGNFCHNRAGTYTSPFPYIVLTQQSKPLGSHSTNPFTIFPFFLVLIRAIVRAYYLSYKSTNYKKLKSQVVICLQKNLYREILNSNLGSLSKVCLKTVRYDINIVNIQDQFMLV